MSSFKRRKEDCNKSFANTSNRLRHEKEIWASSTKEKDFLIVPEFDESKG